jgi:RNA polymerase sigma-70 factor (ECF subfamily)
MCWQNISDRILAIDNNLILSGLKKGDQNLFKALFKELYTPLTQYSASITGDIESSRELVQDLFLETWEKRLILSIKGSFKAYLFTAIYHKSLNWLRAYKIRELYAQNPVEIQNWFPGIIVREPDDPLRTELINKEIHRLPDRCREVFTRSVILGEAQSEIASFLGLSSKTVENHLARAKKILRSRLKKIR